MLALSCPCPQRLVLPSPSCTHMTLTLFFYIHFQRGGGGRKGARSPTTKQFFGHQLAVLQFNSILMLSPWR